MKTGKILIIQTAFLGDMILTLPVLQVLKKNYPEAELDILCIPATSGLLKNNPFVNEVVVYDKKKSGVKGLGEIVSKLRRRKYDLIISPHRSFRSALISRSSSAKRTISFDRSSLSFFYDETVAYDKVQHEILRNLKLLNPLGLKETNIIKPELFIGDEEKTAVSKFLSEIVVDNDSKILSLAPGSVWFTKRFPKEKFVKVCDYLIDSDVKIILIGGEQDKEISDYILKNSKNKNISDSTGMLTILESAEMIRRSRLLLTNDSAPLHIGNAVGTNVIAIFGATIPGFGFYPYVKDDEVVEITGLRCRPCSIHGGDACPVKTFDCMLKIDEQKISQSILQKIK